MRIIIQNRANYLTLFVGIVFANILLLFGMMMTPLLSHFQEEIVDNMIAAYQYVLKMPVETENPSAEKYCAVSLKTQQKGYSEESVNIYGIWENSRYVAEEMPGEGVYVSDGFAKKYNLKNDSTLELKEAYGNKTYAFQIKGTIDYPAAMAVFMSKDEFYQTFELEDGYFNGYFSDTSLSDVDEAYLVSCITEDDLTKTSRQLNVSMGNMFYMVNGFAIILAALLIYLLTKLILEKNTTSISMVKILGYENREIAGLYLFATTWVVVISEILSLFLSTWLIEFIYKEMMKGFNGWLTYYIKPEIYGEMFVMIIAVYGVVAWMQFQKIKKIPMDEALKNVE